MRTPRAAPLHRKTRPSRPYARAGHSRVRTIAIRPTGAGAGTRYRSVPVLHCRSGRFVRRSCSPFPAGFRHPRGFPALSLGNRGTGPRISSSRTSSGPPAEQYAAPFGRGAVRVCVAHSAAGQQLATATRCRTASPGRARHRAGVDPHRRPPPSLTVVIDRRIPLGEQVALVGVGPRSKGPHPAPILRPPRPSPAGRQPSRSAAPRTPKQLVIDAGRPVGGFGASPRPGRGDGRRVRWSPRSANPGAAAPSPPQKPTHLFRTTSSVPIDLRPQTVGYPTQRPCREARLVVQGHRTPIGQAGVRLRYK